MLRQSVIVSALALLAACAARAPRAPIPTLADADQLATAGCYTCMADALKIYESLPARRQSPATIRGAFRTALLLALREKEVGLPATPYLERARALAASLPPSDEAGLALAVAEALPWEQSALSTEINEEFIKTRQASTGRALEWRGRLRPLRTEMRLDLARDDVERAKQLAGLRPEVFLVAGMIYYDRRELETAAADLEKAWQLSESACDASWYLGLVRSDQKQWDVAAGLFPRAAACYRSTADTYRAERGLRQAAAEGPDERAEIDAEFERLIEQQIVSESRSYYNAAYSCAQHGDRERAIEYAERAVQHQMMRDKAAELIAALKKSP